MALKKPIVMTAGEFEQLQTGDMLYSPDMQELTNVNANAVTIGQPVYISGDEEIDLAQANAAATKNVAGLVADASVANNAAGYILTDGLLVATAPQWFAVVGAQGLTPGASYYLDDANAGLLTLTPPNAGGSYVAKVGSALGVHEMAIEISGTVKL